VPFIYRPLYDSQLSTPPTYRSPGLSPADLGEVMADFLASLLARFAGALIEDLLTRLVRVMFRTELTTSTTA
jgi:hypothetical protein